MCWNTHTQRQSTVASALLLKFTRLGPFNNKIFAEENCCLTTRLIHFLASLLRDSEPACLLILTVMVVFLLVPLPWMQLRPTNSSRQDKRLVSAKIPTFSLVLHVRRQVQTSQNRRYIFLFFIKLTKTLISNGKTQPKTVVCWSQILNYWLSKRCLLTDFLIQKFMIFCGDIF